MVDLGFPGGRDVDAANTIGYKGSVRVSVNFSVKAGVAGDYAGKVQHKVTAKYENMAGVARRNGELHVAGTYSLRSNLFGIDKPGPGW